MNKAWLRRVRTIGLTSFVMAGVALGSAGTAQAQASISDSSSATSAPTRSVPKAATVESLLFYRGGDGTAVTGIVNVFTGLQNVGPFSLGWAHITSATA